MDTATWPRRPFEIVAPQQWTAPAVFNSPHSGARYPQSFLALTRLDARTLRKSEDCYIDELFAAAVELGAPLLRADFPRAYLDVNREPYELDPRMFAGELPAFVNTASVRVAAGLGTIPRLVSEGEEIYRAPLPLAEAWRRIDTLYRPYHRTLSRLMEEAHRGFGHVLLVDCHSMPSSASGGGAAKTIDVVLGDRHGASCAEEIVSLVEDLFEGQGLRVARNKPYAGGFIAHNYGSPRLGKHVLQIEINRALYMDERSLDKIAGFERVRWALRTVLARLTASLNDIFEPVRAAAE
jgi:N-formylglutamate amidohydrolase